MRRTPAKMTASPKEITSGASKSLDDFKFSKLINGCAMGCVKTCSGAISTPKKGKTAPILTTSAKDAAIISKKNTNKCPLRRVDI